MRSDPPTRTASADGPPGPVFHTEHVVWAVCLAVQWLAAGYLVYLRVRAANAGITAEKPYAMPFYHLLATMDWSGAVVAAITLSLAIVMPLQSWVSRIAAALEEHAARVAVAVTVIFGILSVTAHQAYPFTSDEFAPVFQSKIFAEGRITGQWPPQLVPLLVPPRAFLATSRQTGQCCSDYAPGHALLLTPFTAMGIPWACNPVLAGVCTWLLASVARQAFGRRAAGWSLMLALASPVFMAYGISFYAMMAHATLNLLYVWLLLQPTLPRVAAAGFVGGFALVLHNPFPHTVFALPWIVSLAIGPRRWVRLAVIAVCYAVVFLPIDGGWNAVESAIRDNRAWGTPQAAVATSQRAEQDGSVLAPPPLPTPTVWDEMHRLGSYFSAFKLPSLADLAWSRFASFLRLVAWDAPALVTLACFSAWRNRNQPHARLLAGSVITTFVAYAFIPVSGGHGWGYRYFFPVWTCLPLLAGSLAARTPVDRGETGVSLVGDVLCRAGLAALVAAAISLPMRCHEINGFIETHRRQMPPVPTGSDGMTVITCIDPKRGYFRTDLVRNDPFLRFGPYVFVSDGGSSDEHNVAMIGNQFGLAYRKIYESQLGTTWTLFRQPANGAKAPGR